MNPELLAKRPRRFLREASTWFIFFLISAGLGYPALNRYDPHSPEEFEFQFRQFAQKNLRNL
jgi:hypothetical protein